MNKKMLEEIKKTIIFLGHLKQQPDGKLQTVLVGTGFLIQIDQIFHLITAKHVIANIEKNGKVISEKENMMVFTNLKDKDFECKFLSIDRLKKSGINWLYHEKDEVDLAIIAFPIDVQNDDVKFYPKEMFLSLSDVYETNEVFYLSYQPSISVIESDGKVLPIARRGMVSRINRNKTFYIDGFAFPGNSGSPVFMYPSATRVDEQGNIHLGRDPLAGKFLGIIGEYLPYQDVAVSLQTEQPRVIFEENTGLSKVWSVEYIDELIENDSFKKGLDKIKSSTQKGTK